MQEYLTIRELDKIVIVDIQEKLIEDDKYDLLLDTLAEVTERKKNVGINLKAIQHLNSRTIHVLLVAIKKIHHYSKELYIISPSETVEALFYMNNLDRILFIVANEKELID